MAQKYDSGVNIMVSLMEVLVPLSFDQKSLSRDLLLLLNLVF